MRDKVQAKMDARSDMDCKRKDSSQNPHNLAQNVKGNKPRVSQAFYGVGDTLKTHYTKAEQYAIIEDVERRCKKYLDPRFDATSFIYPRDNFAITAGVESICVFKRSVGYPTHTNNNQATHDSSLSIKVDSSCVEIAQACRAKALDKPSFTIAIPTYKRVELLRRALLSALAQEFDEDYEIIVVENPLEPHSYAAESMLQEFAHRITYYQNAQNLGGMGNFNRCLALASGKWVCLLHSDDELEPNYLSTMKSLVAHSVYENAILIGAIEDKSEIYPRTILQKLYSRCIPQARLRKLQMRAFCDNGFYALPPRALLHNRARVVEIGGYDEDEAPSGDMTFFNRAARAGEVFSYAGALITRNHYEASSCQDPHVALMMILQNPQMFLAFMHKLTYAHILGNYMWWSQYFSHLPLLRLYAQMRLQQQFKLFDVRPSWSDRSKQYVREHCYFIFAILKAIKLLLTGRLFKPKLESTTHSNRLDSHTEEFMPPPN